MKSNELAITRNWIRSAHKKRKSGLNVHFSLTVLLTICHPTYGKRTFGFYIAWSEKRKAFVAKLINSSNVLRLFFSDKTYNTVTKAEHKCIKRSLQPFGIRNVENIVQADEWALAERPAMMALH